MTDSIVFKYSYIAGFMDYCIITAVVKIIVNMIRF